MTFWQPVHTIKIACGAGGAYVDVTALGHVLYDQGGVTRSWGRQSSFNDFAGGMFAFTLDCRDGRYVPDNTTAGATPLSEGMSVTWQIDTGTFGSAPSRLISGKIAVGGGLQLIIPDVGNPGSARIRVTVSDMLVEAGRHTPSQPLAGAAVMGSSPYFYYPCNEPAGSVQAVDATGNGGPLVPVNGGLVTFGVAGVPATGETQMTITAPTPSVGLVSMQAGYSPVMLPPVLGSFGYVGFWFDPSKSNETTNIGVAMTNKTTFNMQLSVSETFGSWNPWFYFGLNGTAVTANGNFISSTTPTYLALGATYPTTGGSVVVTVTLYANGVPAATSSFTTVVTQTLDVAAFQTVNQAAGDSMSVSHLSWSPVLVHEEYAAIATEAGRLVAIDATTPEITLGTLPADMSLAAVGPAATSGQSALDMLNDVARTEQGQLFTNTAGTGGAPVQTIGIRARNRPSTVTATWVCAVDITDDIASNLIRDLSNTVSEVDGTGIGVTAIVTDTTLKQKVGSANTSFNTLNNSAVDVAAASSDRINRGRKTGLDITGFTVDGMGLTTSRAIDLLGLTLGDRHQVAGLPTAQLGYSTRDGWLSGADELWTPVSARFTLYLENCTAQAFIVGTDRGAAGGFLNLNTTITSGATTILVNSTANNEVMEPTTFPYDITIDSERLTVTGCNTATPQSATVTRGAGGTTVAAHTAGALIEIFQPRPAGF